jgi:RNA-directed DNA polymerase
MTRISAQAVRHAIALNGNPRTLVSRFLDGIDPYCPDSLSKLEAALDEAAKQSWISVVKVFSSTTQVGALENSWAIVSHLPEWTALLFRAAQLSGQSELVKRSEELSALAKQEWDLAPFVSVVAFRIQPKSRDATNSICPDLLQFEGVSPKLRVRFALANRVALNTPWPQLIEAAASVPELSSTDLIRLLEETGQQTDECVDIRLSLKQAATLSVPASKLLVKSNKLLQRLCPVELVGNESVGSGVLTLGRSYRVARARLESIAENLSNLQWSKAGRLSASLEISRELEFAAQDCLDLFKDARKSPGGNENLLPAAWRPMTATQAEFLNKLFSREMIRKRWTLSATEIAVAICHPDFGEPTFSRAELALLNWTWGLTLQRKIVRSGKSDYLSITSRVWDRMPIDQVIKLAYSRKSDGQQLLVEQLQREVKVERTLRALVRMASADAVQMVETATNEIASNRIELRSRAYGQEKDSFPLSPTWSEWLAPEVGKSTWLDAVATGLIEKATPEQVMFVWLVCPTEEKTKRFRQHAQAVLSDSTIASFELGAALVEQIASRPASAEYIVPAMSVELATMVADLDLNTLTDSVLLAVSNRCNKDQLPLFWTKQLERVGHAKELENLLMLGIKNRFEISWSNKWTQVSGNAREKARALSLIACRHPGRIQKLKVKYGETNLSAGMLDAAKLLLPYRTGDAVLLELVAALGPRHAPSIQWLLMKRDRAGSKGGRLDALYESYEIPKKSGAMRKISAPHSTLKRVQRSILVSLLNPLGAHACAHGFVTGRSIATNAQGHVKKRVVVNADVSSCFPSVKWPLVLASLKRDFGEKYSAQTISALTDICTANGALPIGAPTSPALLNRVLLKTDEILAAKAQERECSYSRYADDITFSGDDRAVKLIGVAASVIKRIGLEFDPKKTNVFRRGRRQMCTGLVVNDKVSVPRRLRRNLRAALHAMQEGKKPTWNGKTVSSSVIRGWLEYLRMIDPEASAALIQKYDELKEQ